MKIIIYLLLGDIILAVAGQLLLKKGMTALGPVEFSIGNILPLLTSALKNVYIWIALICYAMAMILWMFILTKVELSVAYPATALIYVLVVFSSWLFLKEAIGLNQLIGTSLIVFGLFFLLKAL